MKGLLGTVVVAVLFLAVGLWVTFFAPCDELGWLPLKEAPLRCLGALR